MSLYCSYCGRVIHRCQCAQENSRTQEFFARASLVYHPSHMPNPYKRGVPPLLKKRERATLRKHYAQYYQQLCEEYGEHCANCGDSEEKLVLDHIISIAKGGKSELSNLQILCAECNRIKGKLCIDCRQLRGA